MANENTILTRLALKIDTYANWTLDNATTQTNKTHANLVLMRGEIGLCEIPESPNTGSTEATTAPTILFKVGDGTSPFKNLKWASAKASDVYEWAKQSQISVSTPATETTVTLEDGTSRKYTGNAVTAIEWDATLNDGKGGLKFTKGTQFATRAELDAALDAFGGDLAAITDNNTTTAVSLETTGNYAGQLKITTTEIINGKPGTSTTSYIDVVTPDELDDILEDYVKTVNKVTGTAITVDNTDDQNPKIGFIIDPTQGENVTVTQSNIGLKVEVDLSDYRKIDDDEDTITVVDGGMGIEVNESVDGDTHTYLVSHQVKPSSGEKETNTTAETAATTFVTGVEVDIFGHVAGVTTAEVVVPDIDYQEDTTATVPTTDTVEVVGSLSVNNNNNKHNLIEDAVEVATAEAFTYRNTEKPINTVGGIGTSTDMSEITFKEFVTKLLYPYTKPAISASRTPSTTSALEKGNNQTITKVAVTVTKKSEPITSVALYNGSTLIEEKTTDVAGGGTFNFTVSVPVNSTNVVLTAKATDAAGSTVTANTANWSFVYPYYYGVCTVEEYPNLTGADLRDSTKFTKDIAAKGNKNYSYTTNNQCMVIAFPSAHGVLKSAKDPSGFQNIDEFTPNRREISITGLDGSAQTYYVYRNNPSTNTGFTVAFTH